VIGTEVRIKAGDTARLTVRFRVPGTHGRLTLLPSARVPAMEWRDAGVAANDERPLPVRW